MANPTCMDLVSKNVKDLTEKELNEVLDELKQRQFRLVQQGQDPNTAAAMAGMQLADTLRAAAAIEKRNAAINLRIKTEAVDYLRTTWADDPTEGVLALLYGSPKSRFGSRASVNAAQDANFRRYISGVQNELEQAGLFDVLRRGELDRDVARAMWSVDNEVELAKLPKQAQEIAKTLRKWQEVARIEANRHGAWIGKEDNYIVRQSHHPDRIASAGEATWKADIMPKLDLARMFPEGPPNDLDNWFRETFLNITTGVRPDGELGARMSAFKGPSNLAKKASAERVLHFKSADDWFDYNAKYGYSNLREAYVQGLHRSAESTGLMQVLGTNPESNLNFAIQATRERLSRTDPKALKEFDKNRARFDRGYREVSGATRQVASPRLAAVGAGLRVWNTLTGLGGAVVSAVTDIPVRASALRFQGQSYLGAIADGVVAPIRRLVSGVGDSEKRATLAAAGYFNEIALGNLAARFSPDDSVPSRLNRATNTFFKWNLLAGWTDEMRRASLESMARFFGEVGDYASLSDRTRQTLDRFRITEADWGVMRNAVDELDGGEKFLTPEGIRELPAQEFGELAKGRINSLKEGLYKRIQKRTKKDAQEQAWATKRAEKFRADFDSARTLLSNRIASADERIGAKLGDLSAKLSKLEEDVDFAEGYWLQRVARSERVGLYGKRALRDAGISEGRAREASKSIASKSRQLSRDLAALKEELGEAFVAKWTERQDDLVAFSESMQERINARAEATKSELEGMDSRVTRILEDTREATANKLQQLYADELNAAVISPDARTLATIRQGNQAGTPVGEALRLFWQFKSFGLAIFQRGLMREFYGYDKGRGGRLGTSNIKGMATLLAGSLAFGYVAMSLKDMIRGKKPRPLDNPRTWMAAATQGGGFGIYGDFLFGEASRMGGGFLATLGGPTVGKADEMFRLWNGIKAGDDVGAQAFRVAINNTPYNNLFYTRMAAEYLFLYEVQEALNPGYLRRMERRVEQTTGQEWWLRPSEVAR